MKKKLLTLILASAYSISYACTSFGYITEKGTVIAKNRDFEYSNQSLEVLTPNRQFVAWYNNPYNHKNKTFALMANNDVKMAINEHGLTAIEEDPPYPADSHKHRRYIQPHHGYAEGMVLWAVAQNFNTVEEIKPYIKDIFSHAAPNYYEFADDKQILIVEVAYGKTDEDTTRAYSYKIINKANQDYTHTNYYMDKQFEPLNKLTDNQYSLAGAIDRNTTIKKLIDHVDRNDENIVDNLLLATKSNIKNPNDTNWCLNTSIFRSNLQGESMVDTHITSDKIYGTVSSMIVYNYGGAEKTRVAINIIDKITVLANGEQQVDYREVREKLPDLMRGKINYTAKSFIRKAPKDGVCE